MFRSLRQYICGSSPWRPLPTSIGQIAGGALLGSVCLLLLASPRTRRSVSRASSGHQNSPARVSVLLRPETIFSIVGIKIARISVLQGNHRVTGFGGRATSGRGQNPKTSERANLVCNASEADIRLGTRDVSTGGFVRIVLQPIEEGRLHFRVRGDSASTCRRETKFGSYPHHDLSLAVSD